LPRTSIWLPSSDGRPHVIDDVVIEPVSPPLPVSDTAAVAGPLLGAEVGVAEGDAGGAAVGVDGVEGEAGAVDGCGADGWEGVAAGAAEPVAPPQPATRRAVARTRPAWQAARRVPIARDAR